VTLRGRSRVPAIDVRDAAAGAARSALGAGGRNAPVLVDVRERNELVRVRAPGAVLYPASSFLLRFEELPRDRPIHVICNGGSRSAAVTAWLLHNGWTDVHDVAGRHDRLGSGGPRDAERAARPARGRPGLTELPWCLRGRAARRPRLRGYAARRRRLRIRLKKSPVCFGWL
jgi:rhodanese-related sulfurtransferase